MTGELAISVQDLIRQIAMEHDIQIISGKVSHGHIQVFISYHPHRQISKIVHWLKGISSRVLIHEFPHIGRTCA